MSVQDIHRAFCNGLLWLCDSLRGTETTVHRSLNFPTWSWVGLVGRIKYVQWYRNRFKLGAVILVESSNGGTTDIAEMFEEESHKGRIIPELSPCLHIKGFVTQVRLKATEVKGVYALCPALEYPKEQNLPLLMEYGDKAHIDLFTNRSLISRLELESWDAIALNN